MAVGNPSPMSNCPIAFKWSANNHPLLKCLMLPSFPSWTLAIKSFHEIQNMTPTSSLHGILVMIHDLILTLKVLGSCLSWFLGKHGKNRKFGVILLNPGCTFLHITNEIYHWVLSVQLYTDYYQLFDIYTNFHRDLLLIQL